MASIGIIANPASGKDIRRLVSHATVIDNNEKINIVERIVLGAQALGVKKVFVMPDSYNMGYRVEDKPFPALIHLGDFGFSTNFFS
jgi:predicted polyphosphate/ATP-dependent NAD kinase